MMITVTKIVTTTKATNEKHIIDFIRAILGKFLKHTENKEKKTRTKHIVIVKSCLVRLVLTI